MSSKIIFLTSLIALTSILGLSAIDSQQTFAAFSVISDDAAGGDCITLGGTWSDRTNTCTFTNDVSVSSDDSLIVNENVTVVVQDRLDNAGTLTNNGSMEFTEGEGDGSESLDNFGTITNNDMENDILFGLLKVGIINDGFGNDHLIVNSGNDVLDGGKMLTFVLISMEIRIQTM